MKPWEKHRKAEVKVGEAESGGSSHDTHEHHLATQLRWFADLHRFTVKSIVNPEGGQLPNGTLWRDPEVRVEMDTLSEVNKWGNGEKYLEHKRRWIPRRVEARVKRETEEEYCA